MPLCNNHKPGLICSHVTIHKGRQSVAVAVLVSGALSSNSVFMSPVQTMTPPRGKRVVSYHYNTSSMIPDASQKSEPTMDPGKQSHRPLLGCQPHPDLFVAESQARNPCGVIAWTVESPRKHGSRTDSPIHGRSQEGPYLICWMTGCTKWVTVRRFWSRDGISLTVVFSMCVMFSA